MIKIEFYLLFLEIFYFSFWFLLTHCHWQVTQIAISVGVGVNFRHFSGAFLLPVLIPFLFFRCFQDFHVHEQQQQHYQQEWQQQSAKFFVLRVKNAA